jgi:hypothetical protein
MKSEYVCATKALEYLLWRGATSYFIYLWCTKGSTYSQSIHSIQRWKDTKDMFQEDLITSNFS